MVYQLTTRFGRNSHQIGGREALDNEALYRHVPSVFALEAHDSRSDRYASPPSRSWKGCARKVGFRSSPCSPCPATAAVTATPSICCACAATTASASPRRRRLLSSIRTRERRPIRCSQACCTHHVSGVDQAKVADARIGSVIEIGAADAAPRPADRAIAGMAEDGIYRPSRHLEQARFDGCVPGGDYEGFVDAHMRRLEALRRNGIVERIDADQWRIPQDFEARAAAHDAGQGRQLNIRVLSTFDLEKQITADGATWLDRRLVARGPSDVAPAGFGQEVSQAMDRRRERLIEQGDATRQQNGRLLYRRDLLSALEAREVARAGTELAATKPMPFRAAGDGETVSGTFTGTVQLTSGKFAIVEKSHEFTLVPWRPVIDRQIGKEVTGIVQGGSVSWQMGRQRGLGL